MSKVFYLDSDPFGANWRAICVFEETDHIGFCRLLKSIDGPALEAPLHGGIFLQKVD